MQIGYSAGSRDAPAFDWVRNLLSTRHTPDDIEEKNVNASSVCAFFWNLMRCRLPDEVLHDFDSFIKAANLCRMDAKSVMAKDGGSGVYTVFVGEKAFEFHEAELAPPAGLFAENYSR